MSARAYRTRQLPDGTILCVLDGSAETYLEGTPIEGGILRIDAMRVAENLRGQGISHDLFREVLQEAGTEIHTIEAWLTGTNAMAVRDGLDRGLSANQAAAESPLGKTAMKFGFTRVRYDAFIGLFQGSR